MHLNAEFSSEAELNQTLDFLYQKSKQKVSFTGLLEAVVNEVTIVTAIHNIKSNGGTKTTGVDKVQMNRYLQMPKEKVIQLIRKNFQNYYPKPAKRIYIEKSNGKLRPLGIPTILDRIMQECVRIIIEPICEARFYPHSYGFRPYRAQKNAVRGIINVINGSKRGKSLPVYALEGDIKGCFDNINHRILLKKLWHIGIHDKRIIKIIYLMLKAGYMEYDAYVGSELGIGQGGIISPLLSNVYLNDFDWYVGRMYYEPYHSGQVKYNQMRKLRDNGIYPKYNFRFADDWVILTTAENEAYRLKKHLTKYFKHQLKLELSVEKTKITDMRINGIEFLGFVITVEKSKRNLANSTLVAKPYPNMERIHKKIKTICTEIRRLKLMNKTEDRIAQILYVNSIIMGVAEYIKTGISSKAYNKIDYAVNNCCFTTWKYLYPDNYLTMKKELQQLSNNPERHKNHISKTFAIQYQGKWIGITMAYLTHIQYEAKPFNQNITPYTAEGRMLYSRYRKNARKIPLDIPMLANSKDIKLSLYAKDKYNFEYFMNREYAFNRDKGKCRCCGKYLFYDETRACHHVEPYLPLNLVNKVTNLAWVCDWCHRKIHSSKEIDIEDVKIKKKIEKFREKIKKSESTDKSRDLSTIEIRNGK